jgi:hypothetical protein
MKEDYKTSVFGKSELAGLYFPNSTKKARATNSNAAFLAQLLYKSSFN